MHSAEGATEYSAPQIADRAEPFRPRIREVVGAAPRSWRLRRWGCARGPSTRDIEALFTDRDGRRLLSCTAVSEITEWLWAECEGACRAPSVGIPGHVSLVDGIAERLHLGQPREG